LFELLCNILLFVFLGFTYFTHVLEAKVPKSYMKNPNVLHPSVWPKAIIILLLIGQIDAPQSFSGGTLQTFHISVTGGNKHLLIRYSRNQEGVEAIHPVSDRSFPENSRFELILNFRYISHHINIAFKQRA
jgi:hypothetical protein